MYLRKKDKTNLLFRWIIRSFFPFNTILSIFWWNLWLKQTINPKLYKSFSVIEMNPFISCLLVRHLHFWWTLWISNQFIAISIDARQNIQTIRRKLVFLIDFLWNYSKSVTKKYFTIIFHCFESTFLHQPCFIWQR